jgi:hypothetical protein
VETNSGHAGNAGTRSTSASDASAEKSQERTGTEPNGLLCDFHGEFPREMMMCPKCYRKFVKRNKELLYEKSIKS